METDYFYDYFDWVARRASVYPAPVADWGKYARTEMRGMSRAQKKLLNRRFAGIKSALHPTENTMSSCAKSSLFHVAAILHPSEAEAKNGIRAKVILQPQAVVAESEKQANLIAVRAIQSLTDEEAGRVEVFVSPF